MLRLTLILFALLSVCFSLYPQSAAVIEADYIYTHPVQTMKSAEADVENHYTLHTDGRMSKFYSPRTEFIDSIESTPEGFEAFNTLKRVAWQKGEQDKIPRVDGSFYVTKFSSPKRLHTYDIASGTKFHMTEPLPEISWEINDSTKNILGYECVMATAGFHGRKWTAWFAREIPVSDGPWKLRGLPGLILEAASEGEQYRFVARGLRMSSKPVTDVYGAHKWEEIDRKEFWRLRRSCLDNPSRTTAGSGSTIVYKGIAYEKYLPATLVDYIETDYR